MSKFSNVFAVVAGLLVLFAAGSRPLYAEEYGACSEMSKLRQSLNGKFVSALDDGSRFFDGRGSHGHLNNEQWRHASENQKLLDSIPTKQQFKDNRLAEGAGAATLLTGGWALAVELPAAAIYSLMVPANPVSIKRTFELLDEARSGGGGEEVDLLYGRVHRESLSLKGMSKEDFMKLLVSLDRNRALCTPAIVYSLDEVAEYLEHMDSKTRDMWLKSKRGERNFVYQGEVESRMVNADMFIKLDPAIHRLEMELRNSERSISTDMSIPAAASK